VRGREAVKAGYRKRRQAIEAFAGITGHFAGILS
jgi:hypothetical protein